MYIKQAPKSVLIYADSTQIFFEIHFSFTPWHTYYASQLDQHCRTLPPDQLSCSCILNQMLTSNLAAINARSSQLIAALTGKAVRTSPHLDPPITERAPTTAIPRTIVYNPTAIPPSTLLASTLTPSSTDSPIILENVTHHVPTNDLPRRPPSNTTEETIQVSHFNETLPKTPSDVTSAEVTDLFRRGRRETRWVVPNGHRPRRQIFAASAAIGAATLYLGNKLFNYFDPPEVGSTTFDAERLYSQTREAIHDTESKNIVLAKGINLLRHDTDVGLRRLADHFSTQATSEHLQITHQLEDLSSDSIRTLLSMAQLSEASMRSLKANHYAQILSSCTQSKLSPLAVSPAQLSHELISLEKSLNTSNMGLAIPLSHISAYFQYPLAHCISNMANGKLTIKLDIPIRLHEVHFQLAEVFSLNFRHTPANHAAQMCHLLESHLFVVIGDQHVYPVNAADSSYCNVDAHFCKFFPYSPSARDNVDCVKALLSEGGVSTEVLHTACPFKCVDHSPSSVSVVSLGFQHNSYSFAVSTPSVATWIECLSLSGELTKHFLPNASLTQGSFLIRLHCGCILKFEKNLHDDVRPPFPCFHNPNEKMPTIPHVSIIIPSRWSYLTGDQIVRANRLDETLLSSEGHANFSKAFNPNWFKSDLVLDVGQEYQFATRDSFIHHLASHSTLYSGGISLFGDVFLACIIFYLFYKFTRLSRPIHVATGAAYAQIRPVRALTEAELTHHMTVWLIAILIFNLLFLGFLVACCIACRKKRRIECVDINPEQLDPEPYAPASRTKINQAYRPPSYPSIAYQQQLQPNRNIGSAPAITFHQGHSAVPEQNHLYPESSFLTRLRNE